ncbi:MAG: tetratricopeptide repeat protein, partial [Cyclobacteriaceae bacterium]
ASEIAYEVGFGSPSYFFKCFHERFGYTPGELKENDRVQYQPVVHHHENRKKWLAAAILVIIGVFVGSAFFHDQVNDKTYTIVVLPLESTDPDIPPYLTEGIQKSVIKRLGMIHAFRVWSQTSSLSLANHAGIDIIENVDYYLKGTLSRKNDELVVDISLLEKLQGDKMVQLGRFGQKFSNIHRLESAIVRSVADNVGVSLRDEENDLLTRNSSIQPEVYQNYLRGMYYLDKRSPEYYEIGMDYLKKAVDLDPGDALAYVGLAQGYIRLGHSASSSNDAFKKAKAAAERALSIDPNLPKALSALGQILMYSEWNWEDAEKAMTNAIRLNPSMAEAHYHYAWYLNLFERKEEAIREHKLAAELDPLGVKYSAWMAFMYASYDEFELAVGEAEQALALDPDHVTAIWAKGLILEKTGKTGQAIEVYHDLAERYPSHMFVLASALASSGKEAEARSLLEELLRKPESPWSAYGIASVYAALNEPDNAFKWLRYKPHHAFVPWCRTVKTFEKFSNNPEFNNILISMNLPPLKQSVTTVF